MTKEAPKPVESGKSAQIKAKEPVVKVFPKTAAELLDGVSFSVSSVRGSRVEPLGSDMSPYKPRRQDEAA